MTEDELTAIEARAVAATPGPWVYDASFWYGLAADCHLCRERRNGPVVATHEDAHVHRARHDRRVPRWWTEISSEATQDIVVSNHTWAASFNGVHTQVDAAFIAHAREDIPALVAEVRRLRYLQEAAEDVFRDGVAELGGIALQARLKHLRSALAVRQNSVGAGVKD